MDWLRAVDLARALANYHYDLIGDWYRDPWGWQEIDWLVANRPDLVAARLDATGVRPALQIDVPKVDFATRPGLIFDPLDRLCYQAMIDTLSSRLIGDLPKWAYGVRLKRRAPSPGVYAIAKEFDRYRRRLQRLARQEPYALKTDIVSFFSSIPTQNLCEAITQRARNDLTRRLSDMIVRWAQIPGRPGLQQRSLASSVLANMYVQPIDDLLAAEGATDYTEKTGYGRAVRWTDDIWLFGTHPAQLRRAQVRIEARIRDLGLSMGAAKTQLLHGSRLQEEVFQLELGYIDFSLQSSTPDPRPLEDLVRKLIAAPEAADRTAIRFACVRVRSHRRLDLADQIADAAHRMPQGATDIARMLRELGLWRGRVAWYLDYCASPWAAIEWAPAQLSTMFPADASAPTELTDFFSTQIPLRHSLPFLALAAQRLASWRPAAARDVIRDAVRRATHPLERRVLALAALHANDERAFVRRLLSEFEENQPTLFALEDSGYRALDVVPDYTGR